MRQGERSRTNGQALVEFLVVLPVLLLLLLAAADLGKLFVISGKSEIAARYIALSHFRQAPFGDAYPGATEAQEIEGLFFDGALDDNSEADDPDVTYEELGDEVLEAYRPVQIDNVYLAELWDYVIETDQLLPIRGARSTFAYDLPALPYGSGQAMEGSRALSGTYDASGNFVVLSDAFSGTQGELIRMQMEAIWVALGIPASTPAWGPIAEVLYLIFVH